MAIVLVKKPELASELLRYITIIREAAQGSPNNAWMVYDEQFSMRQAVHPRPWNEYNSELWMRLFRLNGRDINQSKVSGLTPAGVHNRPLVSAAQPAMGKCHDFNNGQCTWRSCQFLHAC